MVSVAVPRLSKSTHEHDIMYVLSTMNVDDWYSESNWPRSRIIEGIDFLLGDYEEEMEKMFRERDVS